MQISSPYLEKLLVVCSEPWAYFSLLYYKMFAPILLKFWENMKQIPIFKKTWWTIPIFQINICLNSLMPCIWRCVELFSWKTTFHEGHLEVCLFYSRLLPGLFGMWSSMKITQFQILLFCRSLLVWFVIVMKVVSMILWLFLFIEVYLFLIGKKLNFHLFYLCLGLQR